MMEKQTAQVAAIRSGADVIVKLVDAKESGKLTGRAELALSLMSVRVNGRMTDINTQTVNRESSSRGEKTAKVAGGTAAVGTCASGRTGSSPAGCTAI
jgi:predicted Abi (CAAX) family protease